MSASVDSARPGDPATLFSLLGEADHERLFAWRAGTRAFLATWRVRPLLPASGAINLAKTAIPLSSLPRAAVVVMHLAAFIASDPAIAEVRSATGACLATGSLRDQRDMIRLPEQR
jgi:hypothetical protein